MSSWSGSAYPPPRGRSRSRSPYRGASYASQRPPHPEAPYPQDSYRADWDAYDRDRAWANYERERAAYEYSRRGRSRSPPPDESKSPNMVYCLPRVAYGYCRGSWKEETSFIIALGARQVRAQAALWRRLWCAPPAHVRREFVHWLADAHSRGHGHASPHRGQYPPPSYGSSRRAPPDPHTFDYPASLKQYAEWFRYYYPQQAIEEDNADKVAEQEAGDGSKPRNGIRSRWEKYRKDFSAQQVRVGIVLMCPSSVYEHAVLAPANV